MRRLSLIGLFYLCASQAQALGSDGSGWKIVSQMQQSLVMLREQIKLVGDHVRLANDMRNISLKNAKSWDVINDPLFSDYMGDWSGTEGFGALSGTASELQGLDNEAYKLSREYSKTSGEKNGYYGNRDLSSSADMLRKLRRYSVRNFDKANRDLGERDSSQVTAKSTAGVLDLLVDEKAQKIEEQRQQEAARKKAKADRGDLDQALGGALKHVGN
ncbi:MAG: hypothetical protein OQK73_00145 [Gammaproteobacteria bacterium]|nr:hypothetical protein [Gammaproteobacteria bacterium]